jgi:hypothetical protein
MTRATDRLTFATRSPSLAEVTSPDFVVLLSMIVGALLLVGANVALQRVARPDRGIDRIAGCCGMAVRSAITESQEESR